MSDKYWQAYDNAVAAIGWVDRVNARFVRAGREQPGTQAHNRAAALLGRAFARSDRANAAMVFPEYSPLPDVAVRQLPSRRARAVRGRAAR
jgi:hypothetical protein